MPLESVAPLLGGALAVCATGGVDVPVVDAVEDGLAVESVVMVDCEEDREKVLARGARCVSLSSAWLVSTRALQA